MLCIEVTLEEIVRRTEDPEKKRAGKRLIEQNRKAREEADRINGKKTTKRKRR